MHIPFCVTFTFYWEKRKLLWKRLSVFLGFNWSESFVKSWHGPKWTFIKKIIRLKLFYRPPPLIGNVFNWVFLSNSNWFFLLVSQINPPPLPDPPSLFFPSNPGVFCTSGFISVCPGAHPDSKMWVMETPNQSDDLRSNPDSRWCRLAGTVSDYPDSGLNWINWPFKNRKLLLLKRQSKKLRLMAL